MDCLHVCPACERHVRASERACPFCASTLPDDFSVCVPRGGGGNVSKPLTRAALLFVTATAIGGCEKKPNDPNANNVEIYGPAPVNVQDAGPDAAASAPKK